MFGSALHPWWILHSPAHGAGMGIGWSLKPFPTQTIPQFHVLMHPGRKAQQDLLCRGCWSHKEMRAESWMWQSEFWFEQQREKQASSSDLHPELRNVQPHHIPLQKLQIQSSIREQHPCWNPEVLSCQQLLFSSLTPTMVTVLQLLRETPGSMDSLPYPQFYSQLCHCQWGDLRQMFAALILDVSKNPKGLLTRNLFSLCLSVPQGNDLIIYQPSQHLLPPQVQDVLPLKLSLSSQIISPINTTKITQSSFALISPHVQASSFHSTPSLGELSGVFQLHLLAPWTIFLPLVS